jgi:hypothetical protein
MFYDTINLVRPLLTNISGGESHTMYNIIVMCKSIIETHISQNRNKYGGDLLFYLLTQ